MAWVMASIMSNGGRGGDGRGGTSVLWEDLQRAQKLPLKIKKTSFQSEQDANAQDKLWGNIGSAQNNFFLEKQHLFSALTKEIKKNSTQKNTVLD